MTDPVKDGGQAFPCLDSGSNGILVLCEPGMSMRDYFAAAALPAVIAAYVKANGRSEGLGADHFPNNVSAHAYRVADAMLRAREVSRG